MSNTNQQLNNKVGVARRAGDGWYFDWSCAPCMGSGIAETLLGLEQCDDCQKRLDPVSYRLYGAISNLKLKNRQIDSQLLHLARALVSANAEQPMRGEALAFLLKCSERQVKEIAARLCEEWQLPVIATRKPPYGYFIAASAEQLLEWGRVTRSQAVSMLARYYHLFRSNFPELAGQQPLDFVNTVSNELQEAIR